MIEIKTENFADGQVISLEGELTLQHAAEIKTVLTNSILAFNLTTVNFEKATEIDLSFFQLLCSAHHSSLKRNKGFSLSGSFSETFIKVLRETGLQRHTGCAKSPDKTCLWAGLTVWN